MTPDLLLVRPNLQRIKFLTCTCTTTLGNGRGHRRAAGSLRLLPGGGPSPLGSRCSTQGRGHGSALANGRGGRSCVWMWGVSFGSPGLKMRGTAPSSPGVGLRVGDVAASSLVGFRRPQCPGRRQ